MANPALRGVLRRFVRERDGISAVEFALILPFMLTLYLGGSELGDGMAIQFKATLAARTVADLATQYTNIPDTTTMNQLLGAATTVMTPYPTAVRRERLSGARQTRAAAAPSGRPSRCRPRCRRWRHRALPRSI